MIDNMNTIQGQSYGGLGMGRMGLGGVGLGNSPGTSALTLNSGDLATGRRSS